jgi:hypothetical protein
LLSKSQYVRGQQCQKSLWLYKHRSDLRSPPDYSQEALFRTGNDVGEIAKQLFPGGIEIDFDSANFAGMVSRTAQLIASGETTIYEATFSHGEMFAMADIIHKTEKGWNVYEVKASTSVKPYHLEDMAFQWSLLGRFLELNRAHLVHINNQYVRSGPLDVHQLMAIEDVTEEILPKQDSIVEQVTSLTEMIATDLPDVPIGPHCSKPFDCDFIAHCWADVPECSVFNLYRLSANKKFDLFHHGHVHYKDLPEGIALSSIQRLQVETDQSGLPAIDPDGISQFLSRLEYPLSFFDFETFYEAIPRYDNQRPYMQVPFQYSLHVLETDVELRHFEFLGHPDIDPRKELCEKLLEDIPKEGTIISYNMVFEIARIRELAELYPEYHDDLMALTERFIDLIEPFRNGSYYHPTFNGSFSIKSILPALISNQEDLSYRSLSINEGGMATEAFLELGRLDEKAEIDKVQADLLAYCKLDTLAMEKILRNLEDLTESNSSDEKSKTELQL